MRSITFAIVPSISVFVTKLKFTFGVKNSFVIIPSIPNKLVLEYLPVASIKSK